MNVENAILFDDGAIVLFISLVDSEKVGIKRYEYGSEDYQEGLDLYNQYIQSAA